MSTQFAEKNCVQLLNASGEAVQQLKKLMEQEGMTGKGVRLAVRGGGCSGFSYAIGFDEQRDGDNTVEQDGVTFLMDKKSTIYLKGITLDYHSGLEGKGFVFENPNAVNTCGCGSSFSV